MSIDIFSVFGTSGGNSLIPHRDPGACTGSTFIKNNINLNGAAREQNILNEFMHGNIPDFLRNFVPITVTSGINSFTYLVIPDVLAIGNNDDYVRMPMFPQTAKIIADQYDCSLPTKKMCDQIWACAKIKLNPHPKGAPFDASMENTYNIGWHNNVINKQLQNLDKTQLITGHKKDIIIDKQLLINKNKVCIYGWFSANGVPIQGPQPNCTSHSSIYSDYSHSVRLISQDVIFNSQPMRFFDILKDPILSKAISEQGVYDATAIYK